MHLMQINNMRTFYVNFLLALLALGSCQRQDVRGDKISNKPAVSLAKYSSGGKQVEAVIKDMIINNEGPFYPGKYDEDTEVIIDTLLYSPDLRRVALLSILKIKNSKLYKDQSKDAISFLEKETGVPYKGDHYDARAFIGYISQDQKIDSLRWLRIFNLNEFKSIENISEKFRRAYFEKLSEVQDEKGSKPYKYNFGDVKFWNGPIWSSDAQMLEKHSSGG